MHRNRLPVGRPARRALAVLIALLFLVPGAAASAEGGGTVPPTRNRGRVPVPVYLFWGEGCAHCKEERKFLANAHHADPHLLVKEFEVLKSEQNLRLLTGLMALYGERPSGVPVTFIGNRLFVGFSNRIQNRMMKAMDACRTAPCPDPVELLQHQKAGREGFPEHATPGSVTMGQDLGFSFRIPLIGALDARGLSLPILTLVIAGMDSFNPCAFFVLLSLLGLLVHAQSRNKMLLVGGVFVFFSAFISLLVMAAWLNLFLVMANVSSVTIVAGLVSLLIGAVNVKDFFAFRKWISLSIPAGAKPHLFDRMRKLVRSTSLLSILAGTTVLAILANFYELLCTAGFPMVYTRVLTLDRVPVLASYLFLVLYNVIRVLPLLAIVIVFTVTLGRKKLSEQQGRSLKLVSGMMMLGLSAMLLLDPELLNSLTVSLSITAGAIAISLVLAAAARRWGYSSMQ